MTATVSCMHDDNTAWPNAITILVYISLFNSILILLCSIP